jgi:GntR family transcriptional regulator
VVAVQILLQHTGGKPIYEQIAEQMKAQILSGEISAGEQLPSIRTLAKDLHISVITTKRAYEELEREGFVETMQGRGTYVAQQDAEQVREEHRRRIEQKLLEAVEIAKSADISEQEVYETLHILFGGGER